MKGFRTEPLVESPAEAQEQVGRRRGWAPPSPARSSKRSLGCLLRVWPPDPLGPGSQSAREQRLSCVHVSGLQGDGCHAPGSRSAVLQGPPDQGPHLQDVPGTPCCPGKVSVHTLSFQKLLLRKGDWVFAVSLDGPTFSSWRMGRKGLKHLLKSRTEGLHLQAPGVGIPGHLLTNC